MSDANEQSQQAFEAWWDECGQYCRAGGGDYEQCFAFAAWQARDAEVAELKRQIGNALTRDIHSCGPDCQRVSCVNARLREQLAEARARIDALMLEHCPKEMSPAQMAEWARHQRPATAIDAQLKE